jgi:ribosomal protein S18 acetylase RimI-like enzyme
MRGERSGRHPRPSTLVPRPCSIRPATLDDLETVVAMRIALLREHGRNAVYSRLRDDAPVRARSLFAQQLVSATEITFLAERDHVPVGILRCIDSVGSPLLHPARHAYVSSVYVVPSARRLGVLHAMLDIAVRWCRDRGLDEIRLHSASDNPLSNATWDALGFEVVEHLRVRPIARS